MELIDKQKLLKYLGMYEPFDDVEFNLINKIMKEIESGTFDINSLDREEQLIKEVSRLNAELKTACRGLDIRLDEINKQRDKVAEQDKEIQRLREALEHIYEVETDSFQMDKELMFNIARDALS